MPDGVNNQTQTRPVRGGTDARWSKQFDANFAPDRVKSEKAIVSPETRPERTCLHQKHHVKEAPHVYVQSMYGERRDGR